MAKTTTSQIPISAIIVSPDNARHGITDEGLDELAKSIAQHGLLQPVVVYPEKPPYELIIGQRRFLACRDKLKWRTIPARKTKVKDPTHALILSFSENIHRLDLDYRDKMKVATSLLGHLGSVKEVAE